MTHWGWYWKVKKKHLTKKTCSSLVHIDSFKLYKNDMMSGFTVDPLEFRAEANPDHLKIIYGKRKQHSYTIPVDRLSCNYGGYRSYFRCPLCDCRMRFLYFAERSIFLCRKCLNLGYEIQRLRPTMRYEYTSQKVKELVQKRGGDLSAYKKPPRMHKDTYRRLSSKQFYYEHKSYQATNNELREWYGERAEASLDHFFDYVDETKDWRKTKQSVVLKAIETS